MYVLILKHLLIILRLFVLYINYYYSNLCTFIINNCKIVCKCVCNPALYLSDKKIEENPKAMMNHIDIIINCVQKYNHKIVGTND